MDGDCNISPDSSHLSVADSYQSFVLVLHTVFVFVYIQAVCWLQCLLFLLKWMSLRTLP